jgi:D-glycero-D-manno-heptose 1,7-bisphosphate phosphatase
VGIQQVKAVFLDRDGVLNENVLYADTGSYESPRTASDFRLFEETVPSLRALQDEGFALFLVSNQPNVAKKKSTLAELEAVQARLRTELDSSHVRFVEFYYCYHHPESSVPVYGGVCDCRKPSPYFLHKAAVDHSIDLAKSWMIGDRLTDIQCGNTAGVRTVLVDRDGSISRDFPRGSVPGLVVQSLDSAVRSILAREWLMRRSGLVV